MLDSLTGGFGSMPYGFSSRRRTMPYGFSSRRRTMSNRFTSRRRAVP
jgi:hypothetical protein